MAARTDIATRLGAAAGLVGLSGAAAAQVYPPVGGGGGQGPGNGSGNSPTPGSGGNASPTFGGIGSGDPSSSASATPTTTVTSTATATATRTPSGPPATPPGCARAAEVMPDRDTINATGSTVVRLTGTPGSTVDLLAYTQPAKTYSVVRTVTLNDSGVADFVLKPPANTRVAGQQRGCAFGQSRVINVRTALSLAAVRNGTRDYTFSGDSLPARKGGLIISLYRTLPSGQQVLTAQVRADEKNGEWSLNRKFTGSGKFAFVVRTGQDVMNAPGSSNVRRTDIF
jgi:hypothetical protein